MPRQRVHISLTIRPSRTNRMAAAIHHLLSATIRRRKRVSRLLCHPTAAFRSSIRHHLRTGHSGALTRESGFSLSSRSLTARLFVRLLVLPFRRHFHAKVRTHVKWPNALLSKRLPFEEKQIYKQLMKTKRLFILHLDAFRLEFCFSRCWATPNEMWNSAESMTGRQKYLDSPRLGLQIQLYAFLLRFNDSSS